MDKNSLITKLTKAIDESKGDWGRNQYLLKRIKSNKEIITSDKHYLEKLLDVESLEITEEPQKPKLPKKDKTVFLNPNLVKCDTCKKPIEIDEKSIRYQNLWYHKSCRGEVFLKKDRKNKTSKPRKKVKAKDPIQLVLVGVIFVFLVGAVYFILGPISMIAMGLGGGLTVYHMVGATGKLYSRNKPGRTGPSAFLLFLLASPFVIGGMIAYEGYSLLESPTRIILLWAMTISFWSTMLLFQWQFSASIEKRFNQT
ncbi:hypothetical protein AAA799P11_00291 [Marine Group I thaumarchaeote SCGC AAA799-P11]|uniref:Uncharacterized protein n=1 Tax=Marine Group I thaumarchaeote SCGC AAA799-P11 TaxID=1502295 RepID=A0A087S2N3_9ARCH|nr:hypothetical protein AAA799P11_00291 [Marine Group I thaumarchaeote SCGC AAA799-P11]